MKLYRYEASCPELGERVDALNAMIEAQVETTYSAMLRNCAGMMEWADRIGYERYPAQGLTLKNDWHVGYYRSEFEGKPCYFLRWSAMEFIWVKEERHGETDGGPDGRSGQRVRSSV